MGSSETAIVRCELEMAQRALKLQTRRCRQLVSEYTRKLQAKELEAISERRLRDEQLTKVLRSLLVFEARLKQEQAFIRHQLEEKDDLIRRQRKELRGLRATVQYCKTCSQFYTCGNLDSGDGYSSSEFYVGSQEHWESGSELYESISEFSRLENSSGEDSHKQEYDDERIIYEKNKYNKCNNFKRLKKTNSNSSRRMTGTYFEVFKTHESSTESAPEAEDTSSDPRDSQKTKQQIDKVSERIEELFAESSCNDDTFSNKMDSLHGIRRLDTSSESNTTTSDEISLHSPDIPMNVNLNDSRSSTNSSEVLSNDKEENETSEMNHVNENLTNEEKELSQVDVNTTKNRNISETITVFDVGDGEQNDNWYVSASDNEDNDQRDIYRNNPVLECMNQILLQNINDSINSPPKSPDLERNPKTKSQKRVKFSDENIESNKEIPAPEPIFPTSVNSLEIQVDVENKEPPYIQTDYYETPIQGGANFYEVPQSIYSNDYEQILSKCSGDSVHSWSPGTASKMENLQENKINRMSAQKLTTPKCNNLNNEVEDRNHYYIDMEATYSTDSVSNDKKMKVPRTPPALPPKPANLVSKLKLQHGLRHASVIEHVDEFIADSEPDYCSISELNLPSEKMVMTNGHLTPVTSPELKSKDLIYDPISLDGLISKPVDKTSFQAPKEPQTKNDRIIANMASIAQISMLKNKKEPEIPKLPQVSEIIIPEEEEKDSKIDYISQDNYIKNNSQILKQKLIPSNNEKYRNRILIGTSVSNLISNFNNQYNLTQIKNRKSGSDRYKINEKPFSSIECSQDYDKQQKSPIKPKAETPSFEKFDLSQNFEEFNLDDCEIGEEYQSEPSHSLNYNVNEDDNLDANTQKAIADNDIQNVENKIKANLHVAQNAQQLQHLQQLQNTLSSTRRIENNLHECENKSLVINRNPEPSYEHFLECTGLSSKSILTPSRMLSNHKSMLKPKDIKLRSRVKSTTVYEHPTGTVKYWSEPYL